MLGISALCVAVLYISTTTGQPTTCYEGLHCAVGYYCEIDTHVCRECLRCQDLKREPAVTVTPNACIKSVSECGPCTKGLVVDRRGNVDAECVPPDTSTEGGGMTAYLWLFIIAGMLFVGLVLGIIVYVLRNSEEIFKTPAANQRRITSITASAPESPPPYNQVPYDSVPAESPTPYPYTDIGRTDMHELDEHPFIKRASSPQPPSSRESDANQAARVYNPPYYSRKTQPPSVEQPAVSEVEEDTMIAIHDDETTPSAWVPSSDTNVGDDNANGAAGVSSTSLSKQLAVARETTVIESPPAKKPCVRQDTNNNRNRESTSCEGGYPQSPSPGQAGGVITQIINVVQFNNK